MIDIGFLRSFTSGNRGSRSESFFKFGIGRIRKTSCRCFDRRVVFCESVFFLRVYVFVSLKGFSSLVNSVGIVLSILDFTFTRFLSGGSKVL